MAGIHVTQVPQPPSQDSLLLSDHSHFKCQILVLPKQPFDCFQMKIQQSYKYKLNQKSSHWEKEKFITVWRSAQQKVIS